MKKPEKITLEELRDGMSVFLNLPSAERFMQEKIKQRLSIITLPQTENEARHDVDILSDYIKDDTENHLHLKMLLSMSGSSFERFKRVYENAFPSKSRSDIKKDKSIRDSIAKLLSTSSNTDNLKEIPPFIKSGFLLPKQWKALFQDKKYLEAVISHTLLAQYSTKIGEALEEEIRGVAESIGAKHKKGKVKIVDNKEGDVVIPNCNDPNIIIMSSYQLTTSSSQSSKSNEQSDMYKRILNHNHSRIHSQKADVIFINVIDGGGWLERKKDLKHMWRNCDYCFSHSHLSSLKKVIKYHM